MTLRIFGKHFYPSVFGNGNFAVCENLTAATATGTHTRIFVAQETPPVVDATGKTAYDIQFCTDPTTKYIRFTNLDLFAELDYGDTSHQWNNFVTFTSEARKQTSGEAAKELLALLSCLAKTRCNHQKRERYRASSGSRTRSGRSSSAVVANHRYEGMS